MKLKKQRRDKYSPLKEELSLIRRAVLDKKESNASLDNHYSQKLSEICRDLFGLTTNIRISNNDYLFVTEFPSLPSVSDLAVNVGDLLNDEKRDKYLEANHERTEKFRDLKGKIDYKNAKVKGDYGEFSFVIRIDLDKLFNTYNHTSTDVTAMILNEIGKVFAYIEFIDESKEEIEEARSRIAKASTTNAILDILKRGHNTTNAKVTELRRVMDTYDDLSSEFVTQLGWGKELVVASISLKSTYQSVNNRRWVRLLPTVVELAFNIVVVSWLSFISTVGHMYVLLKNGDKILLLLSTMVLILIYAAALFVVVLNIIFGLLVISFSYKDTIKYSNDRFEVIRRTLVKQIKDMNGKVATRDMVEMKEILRTLEIVATMLPKDDGFLKKLFGTKDQSKMLETLRSNDLYVRHVELLTL